ncbi:LysR family transcriptional regulator [Parvibium lacunae]|uniref:LysR family transcriptional regulator n=1 Tax=Parvibium lacunae TaxID=1888893 RepID=A0A368L4P3_9BURK|nr:LysR substrate-binding domain-containing protein [Parvibium lacunae]RCS58443.1 LysR family transcriptional regulator [Parvibium lacunae]
MKLKHVEVLNAIMVTGTVSGAARVLNVTQPAITQTLQHAELQLGFPLFNRVKNRLVPSHEARTLYPEIERLYQQLESVRSLARNLKQGRHAELNVIIVPSLAVHLLPIALKRFRVRYPDVPTHVRTLHSNDVVTAIALRDGDVGVVYGMPSHPAIQVEAIASGHLVVAVPEAYPNLYQQQAIALEDLHQQPVIRIYHTDPIGRVLNELGDNHHVLFSGGTTVQTHHTALVLAEHGFGPAIVDVFTAAGKHHPTLKVLPLVPTPAVHLSAVMAGDSNNVTLSRFFAQCMQTAAEEVLAQLPPA